VAVLLIFNGPGRVPVVETVKNTAEALDRYADDSSCIIVEGRVLTVQARTVMLIDGQPANEPRQQQKIGEPHAEHRKQLFATETGASGAAEHLVDVAWGSPGKPGAPPSEGAGERPDSGGNGTSQGTSAGLSG